MATQSVQQDNSTSKDPYENKVTRENNVNVDYSFPQAEEVWYENDSKLVPIEGETGYVEESIGQAFKQAFLFSFTSKFAILANGTKAYDVVKGNKHVFYIRNKPLLLHSDGLKLKKKCIKSQSAIICRLENMR